jgi:hypothetical protein
VSPASPEAEARVSGSVGRGRPNPLVLLETVRTLRERLGGTEFLRVMGQVRNGWRASDASFIEVTATFEGPLGLAVESKSTYVNGTSRRLKSSRIVTDTVLGPAETGCFLLFAAFPPSDRISSVGLIVTSSSDFDLDPLGGRVEFEGTPVSGEDAFGDLVVSGRLSNHGNLPTFFNEVWTETRDGEGKVSDCTASRLKEAGTVSEGGMTTRTGLDPGQAARFSGAVEVVAASVRQVRHWINWDERDPRRSPRSTPLYQALRGQLTAALEASDDQAASPMQRIELRDALRREVQAIERGRGSR